MVGAALALQSVYKRGPGAAAQLTNPFHLRSPRPFDLRSLRCVSSLEVVLLLSYLDWSGGSFFSLSEEGNAINRPPAMEVLFLCSCRPACVDGALLRRNAGGANCNAAGVHHVPSATMAPVASRNYTLRSASRTSDR